MRWEESEASQHQIASEWRELALSLARLYAERTNGAVARASESGVVFDFAAADPEFGAMQAQELHAHMTDVLRDVPRVEITISEAELLVHPRGVDKGGLLLTLTLALTLTLTLAPNQAQYAMLRAHRAAAGALLNPLLTSTPTPTLPLLPSLSLSLTAAGALGTRAGAGGAAGV